MQVAFDQNRGLSPFFKFSAFKCNFDLAICGFVQDNNDKFDWTRHRGSTPSIATGPCADHTGNGMKRFR